MADFDGSGLDLLGRHLVRVASASGMQDLSSRPQATGQNTGGHLLKVSRHWCWLIDYLGKNYLLGWDCYLLEENEHSWLTLVRVH